MYYIMAYTLNQHVFGWKSVPARQRRAAALRRATIIYGRRYLQMSAIYNGEPSYATASFNNRQILPYKPTQISSNAENSVLRLQPFVNLPSTLLFFALILISLGSAYGRIALSLPFSAENILVAFG